MAAASSAVAQLPAAELPIRRRALDDEGLARLAEAGSERAFASIYERYHQRLYRYCYSILHDGEDAYDALQSTLANALAALQRGQRDAPLRPWLFRIAHNETISLIRRQQSERRPLDAAESCVPSAEARADERARLALLVSDLQELPERQRTVLLMRELGGLSHKDIASALGISVHTVGHAMLAARRSLGEFEEGRGMVCEAVQRSISNGNGRMPARARAHLRDCSSCAEFAAAIPALRADLRALAPPLAPVAAAGLLAGLHGAASTHGAGGGGFMAAGMSGKAAGAALVAKAIASVAIVAVASAGVTGAIKRALDVRPAPTPAAAQARAAADGHRHRQLESARAERASGAATSISAGENAGAVSGDTRGGSDKGSSGPASPATSAAGALQGAGASSATKVGVTSTHSAGAQPHGEGSAARRHRGSADAHRSPVAAAHAHATGDGAAGARREHNPAHGRDGARQGVPSDHASNTEANGGPNAPAGAAGARSDSAGAPSGRQREAQAPAPAPAGETAPAPAPQASSEGERGGRGGSAASPVGGP